ncbi:MAG: YlqD family protein [Vampirovibrionales bacterium]
MMTATHVQVKQVIQVKTLVTSSFKSQATKDLKEELDLIESQMIQIEAQSNEAHKQLEQLAKTGQSVLAQMEQLNQEVIARKQQLLGLKMEVTSQLSAIEKAQEGSYLTTGNLEGIVTLAVGDHLYDKVRNTEILVKDGIITSILG